MNLFSRLVATRRPAAPESLRVGTAEIPLVVTKNARARRISLRLCAATRSIRITLPPRASLRQALAFAQQNAAWLEQQIATRWPTPSPFIPGALIPFGNNHLHLESTAARRTIRIENRLLINEDPALFSSRTLRWLKAEALKTFDPQTRALAARIGKPVALVRVGDAASRWGSCARPRNGSSGGRIAYSWRLIMAPEFVQRSVIAHEVAHLAEPNHAAAFWSLATDLLGTSHAPARAWLAANGPMLHAQGKPDFRHARL